MSEVLDAVIKVVRIIIEISFAVCAVTLATSIVSGAVLELIHLKRRQEMERKEIERRIRNLQSIVDLYRNEEVDE